MKKNYRLEIQQLSWFKRRAPTKELILVSAKASRLKLEDQFFCEIYVMYDDGVERKLEGRVLQNPIRKTWHINAIANGGLSVSILVKED